MSKTRAELDAALYQLHAAVPLWRAEVGSVAALRSRYDDLLGNLVDSADPDVRAYAASKANDLLASHGLLTDRA